MSEELILTGTASIIWFTYFAIVPVAYMYTTYIDKQKQNARQEKEKERKEWLEYTKRKMAANRSNAARQLKQKR